MNILKSDRIWSNKHVDTCWTSLGAKPTFLLQKKLDVWLLGCLIVRFGEMIWCVPTCNSLRSIDERHGNSFCYGTRIGSNACPRFIFALLAAKKTYSFTLSFFSTKKPVSVLEKSIGHVECSPVHGRAQCSRTEFQVWAGGPIQTDEPNRLLYELVWLPSMSGASIQLCAMWALR